MIFPSVLVLIILTSRRLSCDFPLAAILGQPASFLRRLCGIHCTQMATLRKLESSRSFVGQGLRNRFTRPGLPAAGALGLSRARLAPALAEPLQGLRHLFGPVPGLLSWLIERQLGIAGNKKPAPRPVLHRFRAWWESPEKRPRNYWILPLCGFLSCPKYALKRKVPPFSGCFLTSSKPARVTSCTPIQPARNAGKPRFSLHQGQRQITVRHPAANGATCRRCAA